MNDYKLSVSAEPTDEYLKAQQDLMQAIQSFKALTPLQRQQLLEQFFGAAKVAIAHDFLQQYFG